MKPSVRARVGLAIAQLGAVLVVLGGIGDEFVRALMPAHRAMIGAACAREPAGVEALVLLLVHALGSSLVACGLGMLALLRVVRATGSRALAAVVVAMALLSDGVNALAIHATGSVVFVAPLVEASLIALGVAVCSVPRWALAAPRS